MVPKLSYKVCFFSENTSLKLEDHLSLRFSEQFFFLVLENLLLSAAPYQCNIAMSDDDKGIQSFLLGHILHFVLYYYYYFVYFHTINFDFGFLSAIIYRFIQV